MLWQQVLRLYRLASLVTCKHCWLRFWLVEPVVAVKVKSDHPRNGPVNATAS